MNPTKYRHEKTYSWAFNMLYWRQKEIVDGKRIRNKGLYVLPGAGLVHPREVVSLWPPLVSYLQMIRHRS